MISTAAQIDSVLSTGNTAERGKGMILLLIVADDFTGALDTGVQFAAQGVQTRVVVGTHMALEHYETTVLVVDTETRHLPANEAYDITAELIKQAKEAGVKYIYKKTDSALRGNIGAELTAVLKAIGCRQLPFLPAFPQIERITRYGIHYISGVPVAESPFGQDPFEPVQHSEVTKVIKEQSDLMATSYPALTPSDEVPEASGIMVFDAADREDLYHTGQKLLEEGCLSIMAGCAGFAAVLPELLGIASEDSRPLPTLDPRLLVGCGSVNPITVAQMDLAEEAGFARLRLTPQQKLEPHYWQSDEGKEALKDIEEMLQGHPHCIIETNDLIGNQPTADYAATLGLDQEGIRVRIASSLGDLIGSIFTSPSLGTLLLTGGDTLLQCMNCIGVSELEPLCELEKGIVLAQFTYKGYTRHVIAKSGGFGEESLLLDLAARIAKH